MQPAPSPTRDATPPRAAWSVDEFCDRWGIRRNTFYALVAGGELRTSKIGRRRVVTLAQEEAFRQRLEGAAA